MEMNFFRMAAAEREMMVEQTMEKVEENQVEKKVFHPRSSLLLFSIH
jgi:hypothetical protein